MNSLRRHSGGRSGRPCAPHRAVLARHVGVYVCVLASGAGPFPASIRASSSETGIAIFHPTSALPTRSGVSALQFYCEAECPKRQDLRLICRKRRTRDAIILGSGRRFDRSMGACIKPLMTWKCPQCHRTFRRVNQRHACGVGNPATLLKDRPGTCRPLPET